MPLALREGQDELWRIVWTPDHSAAYDVVRRAKLVRLRLRNPDEHDDPMTVGGHPVRCVIRVSSATAAIHEAFRNGAMPGPLERIRVMAHPVAWTRPVAVLGVAPLGVPGLSDERPITQLRDGPVGSSAS